MKISPRPFHRAWQIFAPVFAGTVLAVLPPTTAVAEVMDKEPTLSKIWAFAIPIALVGLLGGSRSGVVGLLLLALAGILSLALMLEIYDPYVGPAILSEAGWSYVIQAHAASGLGVIGPLVGILVFARRTRKQEAATK